MGKSNKLYPFKRIEYHVSLQAPFLLVAEFLDSLEPNLMSQLAIEVKDTYNHTVISTTCSSMMDEVYRLAYIFLGSGAKPELTDKEKVLQYAKRNKLHVVPDAPCFYLGGKPCLAIDTNQPSAIIMDLGMPALKGSNHGMNGMQDFNGFTNRVYFPNITD